MTSQPPKAGVSHWIKVGFFTSQINLQLFWRFSSVLCRCHIMEPEAEHGCECVRVSVHAAMLVWGYIYRSHFLARAQGAECQLGAGPILLCSGKTHNESSSVGCDKRSSQAQQKPSHPKLKLSADCDSSGVAACSFQRT